MSAVTDETVVQCPRCGRPLAMASPEGLCASCLLLAGTESLTRDSLDESALTVSAHSAGDARLVSGEPWGPYRIGRLLGRGGMGEVYEAEQLEFGRRVALKVLRTRLHTPDSRARFLLEGQLAASISHPHTVYIFGSEEIDGRPAISMELLPGGTLKDTVAAEGPLPPARAVSAVLDILGGLDAAQAAGILHRDIKPSNCFVDRDGTVKVGDFGLSISTLARDVRHDLATDGFQGTPQFAPPEQLRGEPLDVRADIYAVGATLYYLLVGRAPFEAPDLQTLFSRVTAEVPVPPRRLRPDVPAGLSTVVMHCLAKSAAERPVSYAALADALRPFAVQRDTPARLSLRFVAGAIDSAILAVPMTAWTMTVANPVTSAAGSSITIAAWAWLAAFVYYLCLEGVWGASLGKRLLGLRVVSAGGAPARVHQVARRVAVYYLPNLVAGLLLLAGILAPTGTFDTVRTPVMLALSLAYFATARTRNGWAAIHDRASGTRVISRAGATTSRVRGAEAAAPAARAPIAEQTRRYGPFAVVSGAGRTDGGRLLTAFDPVLRREVWIHLVAPAAAPISAARRDVSRVSRLHWLTGRRASDEPWDAYEALDGRPFLTLDTVPGWPVLKTWLQDLATELTAAVREASLPALGLDRLWIRRDGRIVLLDFQAPNLAGADRASGDATLSPVELLSVLATHALSRHNRDVATPPDVPLSARRLFDRWTSAEPATLDETLSALAAVAASHDRVRPWRRALPIAVTSAPIVLALVVSVLVLPPLFAFMANSPTREVLETLGALAAPTPPAGSRLGDPEIRTAVERHLVGRHGALLRDDAFWNQQVLQGGVLGELRTLATQILARHPSVSAEELTHLSEILAPELERRAARQGPTGLAGMLEVGGIIISTVTAGALGLVLIGSLLSSLVVPGGILLRQLGHAVVTRTGEEIGRLRSLLRALVAWSPGLVWLLFLAASPKVQGFVPAPPSPLLGVGLALGALAVGAVWTIVRPARGPHDRLAGTWVVPR